MNMLNYLSLLVLLVVAAVVAIFWLAHRRKDPTPFAKACDNTEDGVEADPSEVAAAVKLDSVTRKAERGDLPFMRAIKNPEGVSAPSDHLSPAPAPSAISTDESNRVVPPTDVKVEPSLDGGGAGIDTTGGKDA
jgi:hypothetical protein